MSEFHYGRIFAEVFAITPEGAFEFCSRYRPEVPRDFAKAQNKNFFGDDIPQTTIRDNIAIVPISGPMIKGAGFLEKGFGACDHVNIADDLGTLKSATEIKGVVLHVHSPGGTCCGTPELAKAVADFAQVKPIYGYCESIGASAAYWTMAGCTKIFATPSASLGSIGAMFETTSFADRLKLAGIDVSIFQSGNLKSAGNPSKKISADESRYFQSRVDEFAAMFKAHVAQHRPQIPESAMNGAVFSGAKAQQLGFVDEICFGLTDVLSKINSGKFTVGKTFSSVCKSLVASGMSQSAAISAAVAREPQLHREWIAQGGGKLF